MQTDYREYLRSAAWKAKKAAYRASKLPWRCYCCGAGPGDTPEGWLDLHHKTYTRLGRERLSDLIPLCRSCHDAVHRLHRSFAGDPRRKAEALFAAAKRYRKRLLKAVPA